MVVDIIFLRANEKKVRNAVDVVCNRHDVCNFL